MILPSSPLRRGIWRYRRWSIWVINHALRMAISAAAPCAPPPAGSSPRPNLQQPTRLGLASTMCACRRLPPQRAPWSSSTASTVAGERARGSGAKSSLECHRKRILGHGHGVGHWRWAGLIWHHRWRWRKGKAEAAHAKPTEELVWGVPLAVLCSPRIPSCFPPARRRGYPRPRAPILPPRVCSVPYSCSAPSATPACVVLRSVLQCHRVFLGGSAAPGSWSTMSWRQGGDPGNLTLCTPTDCVLARPTSTQHLPFDPSSPWPSSIPAMDPVCDM
jgi:hypothetical protein